MISASEIQNVAHCSLQTLWLSSQKMATRSSSDIFRFDRAAVRSRQDQREPEPTIQYMADRQWCSWREQRLYECNFRLSRTDILGTETYNNCTNLVQKWFLQPILTIFARVQNLYKSRTSLCTRIVPALYEKCTSLVQELCEDFTRFLQLSCNSECTATRS